MIQCSSCIQNFSTEKAGVNFLVCLLPCQSVSLRCFSISNVHNSCNILGPTLYLIYQYNEPQEMKFWKRSYSLVSFRRRISVMKVGPSGYEMKHKHVSFAPSTENMSFDSAYSSLGHTLLCATTEKYKFPFNY